MASYPASSPAPRFAPSHAALAALAAPVFPIVAVLLTLLDRDELRAWGWAPLDHHGVPWPSALAVGPHGWLQIASFALAGAAVAGLAPVLRDLLPRRRATSIAASATALAGVGLAATAFPLDRPHGDPGELSSWLGSWHAAVHVGGFATAAGCAAIALVAVAVAAHGRSRMLSRSSAALALASAAALALPGAIGWYLFLGGFFAWAQAIALHRLR
jgi:hypothetical protein